MTGIFIDYLPELRTLQNSFYFPYGLEAIPVKTGIRGTQGSEPFQLMLKKGEHPVKKVLVNLFNILLRPHFLTLLQFIIAESIKPTVSHHFGRLSEGAFIIPC